MVCRNCGRELDADALFCPYCGCQVSAGQNSYAYAQNQAYAADRGKGFAIASLVLGIASFFFSGIICGILAIVFGCMAKKKGYVGGMAKAGIICGIIGAAVTFIVLLSAVVMSGIIIASLF